jgi:Fe-Mn family superoxide dismutase
MHDGPILRTNARDGPVGRTYRPLLARGRAARAPRGPIALPALPYPAGALAPAISPATIDFHHGRHHKEHVDLLNDAVAGTRYELLPLERIVVESRRDGASKVLAHAAHAYNHALYWRSLTPDGSAPRDGFAEAVCHDFGNLDGLRRKLAATALADPGNGFVWLLARRGRLAVAWTREEDTPLGTLGTPLFALDVFAHAYFMDHEDRRERYVHAALHQLADWDSASERYAQAA